MTFYRCLALFVITATAGCWTMSGAGGTEPPKVQDLPDAGHQRLPSDAGPTSRRPIPSPTRVELAAGQRLVAVGDIHGDLNAAVSALRLARVIDEQRQWVGGRDIVVQVGDQLDRGDDEQAILDWFEQLSEQAFVAGGGFYPLVGNHETMNVEMDFRYVTEGGWLDFADVVEGGDDRVTRSYPETHRGRVRAFRPGGPYARLLAGHNAVMVVGETAFAHGGILPSHVTNGLENLNAEVQAWMRGELGRPAFLSGGDSVVWSRHYSSDVDEADCLLLDQALDGMGVKRIVVAHTVQPQGINAVCGDKAWRVDVGMSAHYGGPVQALEIQGDLVTVLR